MRKLVVLSQYFPPDMGGASARCNHVVEGMKRSNWDVTVVTPVPHYPVGDRHGYKCRFPFTKSVVNDIEIIRLWFPKLSHDSNWKRIFLHLWFGIMVCLTMFAYKKPDVIFASSPNFFIMIPAFIVKKLRNAILVRNVDDLWPEVFFDLELIKSNILKSFLMKISNFTYEICDAITPISKSYQEHIHKQYPNVKCPIEVIHVGVDTDTFRPLEKGKAKPETNKFTVMYSGVLGILYDFKTLIGAAKELESDENIQFLIRGTGEQEEFIRSQVAKLGCSNVILQTNYLTEEELNIELNRASVFVLPMVEKEMSDKGLPTKLFQYQSIGRPIIVASGGEPINYISETESGIAVTPENQGQLVEAIRWYLNHPDDLDSHGSNGLSYVKINMSVDSIGQKMSDFIEHRVIK